MVHIVVAPTWANDRFIDLSNLLITFALGHVHWNIKFWNSTVVCCKKCDQVSPTLVPYVLHQWAHCNLKVDIGYIIECFSLKMCFVSITTCAVYIYGDDAHNVEGRWHILSRDRPDHGRHGHSRKWTASCAHQSPRFRFLQGYEGTLLLHKCIVV